MHTGTKPEPGLMAVAILRSKESILSKILRSTIENCAASAVFPEFSPSLLALVGCCALLSTSFFTRFENVTQPSLTKIGSLLAHYAHWRH